MGAIKIINVWEIEKNRKTTEVNIYKKKSKNKFKLNKIVVFLHTTSLS